MFESIKSMWRHNNNINKMRICGVVFGTTKQSISEYWEFINHRIYTYQCDNNMIRWWFPARCTILREYCVLCTFAIDVLQFHLTPQTHTAYIYAAGFFWFFIWMALWTRQMDNDCVLSYSLTAFRHFFGRRHSILLDWLHGMRRRYAYRWYNMRQVMLFTQQTFNIR